MYLSVLSKVSGLCFILLSFKSEFKDVSKFFNINRYAWNNLLECEVLMRVVPACGFETTQDKFLTQSLKVSYTI